jgi:Helix-turn-helix domain
MEDGQKSIRPTDPIAVMVSERWDMTMIVENRLYSVAEAAVILRTGPARVREYARNGTLEYRNHGRRILILGSSIAKFLGIDLQKV